MAKLFDIKKAKGSGAIFNEDKLKHINERLLAGMTAEKLIKILTEKFQAGNALKKLQETYGESTYLEIIDFLKNEFKTVKEILNEFYIFFDSFNLNIESTGINYDPGLKTALLNNLLNTDDFSENSIKNIIKATASENGKTAKECYETLRLFVTGRPDGPSILKIIKFLGKDRVIKRLSV